MEAAGLRPDDALAWIQTYALTIVGASPANASSATATQPADRVFCADDLLGLGLLQHLPSTASAFRRTSPSWATTIRVRRGSRRPPHLGRPTTPAPGTHRGPCSWMRPRVVTSTSTSCSPQELHRPRVDVNAGVGDEVEEEEARMRIARFVACLRDAHFPKAGQKA